MHLLPSHITLPVVHFLFAGHFFLPSMTGGFSHYIGYVPMISDEEKAQESIVTWCQVRTIPLLECSIRRRLYLV
jgi:hypothetical protein